MRTRTIPAQITTVEDKIAGNLSLTQILILMVPVFFTTIVFALFPPTMLLTGYKLVLTLISAVICLILAMRVKGKVVANWLVILARYNLRPKYFVFNKNDHYLQTLYVPEDRKATTAASRVEKTKKKTTTHVFGIQELLQFNHLLAKEKLNVRFKTAKKGGLHVAFQKVAK